MRRMGSLEPRTEKSSARTPGKMPIVATTGDLEFIPLISLPPSGVKSTFQTPAMCPPALSTRTGLSLAAAAAATQPTIASKTGACCTSQETMILNSVIVPAEGFFPRHNSEFAPSRRVTSRDDDIGSSAGGDSGQPTSEVILAPKRDCGCSLPWGTPYASPATEVVHLDVQAVHRVIGRLHVAIQRIARREAGLFHAYP